MDAPLRRSPFACHCFSARTLSIMGSMDIFSGLGARARGLFNDNKGPWGPSGGNGNEPPSDNGSGVAVTLRPPDRSHPRALRIAGEVRIRRRISAHMLLDGELQVAGRAFRDADVKAIVDLVGDIPEVPNV